MADQALNAASPGDDEARQALLDPNEASKDSAVLKRGGSQESQLSQVSRQDTDNEKSQGATKRLVSQHFSGSVGKQAKRQVSKRFTQMMTAVIIFNALEIGLSCQFPELAQYKVYLVCDIIFAAFYVFEVCVKFKYVGIKEYFTNPEIRGWNLVDFALTVMAVVEVCVSLLLPAIPDGPMRAILMARVIRLIRVLKVSRGIPALTVTIGGIWESVPVLAVVVMAMLGITYIFAIFFVIEVDHGYFEGKKDPYQNLARAMFTLTDVVVFNAWTDTIPETQMWLLMPFYAFVLLTAFGVVNIIIGVMVEATSDVQRQIELGTNHDHLVNLGQMWEEKIHAAGLSRAHLDAMTEEMRASKHGERRAAVRQILLDILDSEVIEFPQGTTPETLRALLSPSDDGTVRHEDFVIGMGRILLASPMQTQLLSQINQGVLRKLVGNANAAAAANEVAIKDLTVTTKETNTVVKDVSERLSKLEAAVQQLRDDLKAGGKLKK